VLALDRPLAWACAMWPRWIGGLVGPLCWRCGAWEARCATWLRCRWPVGTGLDAASGGLFWLTPARVAAGDRRRHLP
jgi:hypothetical protein